MTAPESSADIELLIADFKRSGVRELHIRAEGFELHLSNDAKAPGVELRGTPAATRAPEVLRPEGASARSVATIPAGAAIVTAPYLGSFYRSPKPGAPPYVDVGSQVTADTELCLVEVMKLFTAVRAGSEGAVHSILASDGEMVQRGQPLFAIVPA